MSVVDDNFPGDWSCDNTKIDELRSYPVNASDLIFRILNIQLAANVNDSINEFKIERVVRHENVKRYLHYTVEKEAMSKNSGMLKENLEEYLWYPFRVGVDNDKILKYGFNIPRQPLPLLGNRLGAGIHLYRNPFALLNGDIVKYNEVPYFKYPFILCRCLVGRCMQVRPDDIDFPIEAPLNFDSVQSRDKNVVLIHNTLRIYPQYYVDLKVILDVRRQTLEHGRLFRILDTTRKPEKRILFMYNGGGSAAGGSAAVGSANASASDNVGLYVAGASVGSAAVDRPAKMRKSRTLKVHSKDRIYFPPRVDDTIIKYFRDAKIANTFVVDLPPQWAQYYEGSKVFSPKAEILLSAKFDKDPLISSIFYQPGKIKNHTLEIYLEKDLIVEVPDIGFKIIKKENRDLFGSGIYPSIYREDFPPVLTPRDVDRVMSRQCKSMETQISLEDFASRITQSIQRKSGYETVKVSPFFILEKIDPGLPSIGDYSLDEQRIYRIPFEKSSCVVCLRIPDPIWEKFEPSWPPEILDFDIRQLLKIYNRYKHQNSSSSFRFECRDLASKTKDLGRGYFEFLDWSKTLFKLDPLFKGKQEGDTFTFQLNLDLGVKITRVPLGVGSGLRPYQRVQSRDSSAAGGGGPRRPSSPSHGGDLSGAAGSSSWYGSGRPSSSNHGGDLSGAAGSSSWYGSGRPSSPKIGGSSGGAAGSSSWYGSGRPSSPKIGGSSGGAAGGGGPRRASSPGSSGGAAGGSTLFRGSSPTPLSLDANSWGAAGGGGPRRASSPGYGGSSGGAAGGVGPRRASSPGYGGSSGGAAGGVGPRRASSPGYGGSSGGAAGVGRGSTSMPSSGGRGAGGGSAFIDLTNDSD